MLSPRDALMGGNASVAAIAAAGAVAGAAVPTVTGSENAARDKLWRSAHAASSILVVLGKGRCDNTATPAQAWSKN